MRTLKAVSSGLSHATRSAGLILCLWLVSAAIALPYTLVVREAVKSSVGASRVHLDMRQRFDMDWYSEYRHEAVGVERLLTPTSVRPAAFLDNLEAWFSGAIFTTNPALVALGVVFAVVWLLMLGGILHRFAYYEKEFSLRSFAAHGAEFFPRFTRLTVVTGIAYYSVYRLGRWLFPKLEETLRDVTVERTVLWAHLAGALLVGLLMMLVKLSSDYAKISTVLTGRRSMLLAAWHGLRFVLSHPMRTFSAYALVTLGGLVLLALLAWIDPGQSQGGLPGVVWALLVGQLMMAVRLIGRLTNYGTILEIYNDGLD